MLFSPSSHRKTPTSRRSVSTRSLLQKRSRKCSKRRLGATLVEFAIVSNVLIVTIFTCMEFARMNMARNLIQDAAYYAARTAIVPGATAFEAEGEANRIMSSMFSNGYTVNCTPITDEADTVSVTVAVELDDIALFVPMFLNGIELTSTATMKTERYSGFYEQ